MTSDTPWEALGTPDPAGLSGARLTAHWAAQIPAALGNTRVPAQPDFGHLSLVWQPEVRALVTAPTRAGLRAGLRPGSLTAVVLAGAKVAHERPLAGLTLAQALDWLAEVVGEGPLARPDHELPAHSLATGAPFAVDDPAALAELERWYADAVPLLEHVRATHEGASAVRLWPHHFDVATLITLDPGLDPEEARSVGVGLSPGDGSYDEPYFYVAPWPYPEAGKLPALTAGGWHTAGWTGAVLRASELVELPDQQGAARTFLGEAVRAARSLLG